MSALGAFDRAIELGRTGGSTNRRQPISLLASERVLSVADAQRAQRTRLAKMLKVIELRQLVDAHSLFLLGPRGREIDPFG